MTVDLQQHKNSYQQVGLNLCCAVIMFRKRPRGQVYLQTNEIQKSFSQGQHHIKYKETSRQVEAAWQREAQLQRSY